MAEAYGEEGYGEGGYGGPILVTKSASVELVAEEEGNLTVTVVDESGNGLSGFSVNLSGPSSGQETTDSEGVAVFDAIEIGDYDIKATKEGWFDATASVTSEDFT